MRATVLVLLAAAGVAHAQPAPAPAPDPLDANRLEADKLFTEGRTLLTAGRRSEACAKFDLSFRKDPRAVGTMLNLAQCHELAGEVATAVRLYSEARARAHDQGLPEHQAAADRKLALLAPRVPHLRIQLPAGAPVATKVIVDQVVLAPDQLADFQADPGTRTITVTAPGRLPYETTVKLAEGEHRTVAIPALQGRKLVEIRPNRRRLWGQIGFGSGAALGALSLALGWYAQHLYWQQFPPASRDGKDAFGPGYDCFTSGGHRLCDAAGRTKLATARTIAHVATGAAIAGVAAMLVGGYVWVRSPATIAVEVGPQHASVALVGRF